MRPENIRAWAEGVEFGHPPPEQPPFDQYGTPIFSYHDAVAYLNRMGNRVAEEAALKRVSQQQNIRLRNGEVKDPEFSNIKKTEPAKQDAEAYLDRQRKILFQNIGAKDVKPGQKAGPTRLINQDREAYLDQVRKRQAEIAEQERRARQRKILFPDIVPKEDARPELGPYRVPKSNDTGTTLKLNDSTPSAPHMVLLRNGETRKLEDVPPHAVPVRDRGCPEASWPLAGTKIGVENSLGIDCTGGKVDFEKHVGQNRHQDQRTRTPGDTGGTHSPRKTSLAPGTSPALEKSLPPRPPAVADQTEAMIGDLVDMGLVE